MASAKLITVFGATGQQGNSVARALLQRGYQVRALTRNLENAKAKALQAAGATLQVANLDEAATVENAVKGSYGVFCVTNFWGAGTDPEAAEKMEVTQGQVVGDACKKFGVKHLVYSGLEHVEPILGKKCPHFDGKGQVEKYLDKIGVPNTSTRYSFYNENYGTFFVPAKQDDSTYTITMPMDGPMDTISVEDGGPAVAAVFDNPSEYIGKKIGLSGEKLTIDDVAKVLTEITGKTVKYSQVPTEVFATFPFPGAADLAAMFEFYAKCNPDRDVELTRKLNPATLTFKAWAEKNKDSEIFKF